MTAPDDATTANTPDGKPADIAEAALGVTPDQLAKYEVVIERFLRGEHFSLDEDGKVQSWNATAEQRFGWSAQEIVGEDFAPALLPAEERDRFVAELGPLFRGEVAEGEAAGRAVELETRRRDNALVKTEVSIVPIRIGDGYPLNKALQDIATHRGNPIEVHRMKKRHADVLRLIVTALDGGEMPDPLDDDGWRPGGMRVEERWQPAGGLLIFDGSDADVVGEAAPEEDGAAAAAGALPASAGSAHAFAGAAEEVHRLRTENESLRTELRIAERETERLRVELESAKNGGAKVQPDLDDPSIGTPEIERALREDGFTLHAQPVLDLRSGEIAQHEVLLRMIGADGGLVMPQAFFGTARRAGLTAQIDQWVVRRVIRTIAEQAQVGRDVTFEVNLGEQSLHDASLLAAIDAELARTGIEPSRLVLAVTERAAIGDPDGTRTLARQLRAMGCGFALDDFGSSFGSFRFLKDLPVDFLKLDGDLIVTLSESRTAQLVVKALVDVARGTGAETIAVFVSDDDTLERLGELGVGYAQGHKVGRPRPVADALSALESQGLRAVEAMPAAQPADATSKRAT
ncbi:MAG TPA: EAL domain-containing protein [Thermoleophilaceae bacterium]|jgi:PAS domain S-box-containing protein